MRFRYLDIILIAFVLSTPHAGSYVGLIYAANSVWTWVFFSDCICVIFGWFKRFILPTNDISMAWCKHCSTSYVLTMEILQSFTKSSIFKGTNKWTVSVPNEWDESLKFPVSYYHWYAIHATMPEEGLQILFLDPITCHNQRYTACVSGNTWAFLFNIEPKIIYNPRFKP